MENVNIIEEEEKQNLEESLAMGLAKENTYKELNQKLIAIEKIMLNGFSAEQKKMFEEYEGLAAQQQEVSNTFYYKKGIESKEVGK